MTSGKTIALTRRTFADKVMSLLSNMLSRLVITFLPRSKCLVISWLQSPSAVILEPPNIKSATVSTVSHLFAMKWWDRMHIFVFWMLNFKLTFSLSSFTFKRLFSSSVSSIRVVLSAYLRSACDIILYFLPQVKPSWFNCVEEMTIGVHLEKNLYWGLPWWYSRQEFACQYRGHGFDPWSRKIPHAGEQLKFSIPNYWAHVLRATTETWAP